MIIGALEVAIEIIDTNDLDPNDSSGSGITEEAWNRLYDAIKDAGFNMFEVQWSGESISEAVDRWIND